LPPLERAFHQSQTLCPTTMPVRVIAYLIAVGLFLGSISSGRAFAQGFTFRTIDVPGGTSTMALGINKSGQIVGAFTSGGISHGFLAADGAITILDPPGATHTVA